ncbi:hypothetical protein Pmani_039513 [Petrolisthes manimaculis]|uniref:Uncharacterized protein n=1 Tax=Petrolisthes manimaculis TaxID=1843537 RepID=A0AAE1NCK4_9EUCA|nr:hypothetical protein Pmani_039513 [Petrolisthes manimaculis]
MFGVCAGVGSVFALLLPDSTHKPMTDTVDQLELLYGAKSHSSNSIEKGVKKEELLYGAKSHSSSSIEKGVKKEEEEEEEGELEEVSATTPLN